MVNNSINQLLFNALAQHQTVVLPGIGSLRFKRVSTKMDRTTLTPPRNMVRYSSREEGVSLLDMIIATSGCTHEEGDEAYRRWLRRVKDGHSVEIEGVGRIERDFFKPCEELERMLNPIALPPLTLHRRRSFKGVWITLAVVAVAAAVGGVWWYMQAGNGASSANEIDVAPKQEVAVAKPVAEEQETVADSANVVDNSVVAEEVKPSNQPAESAKTTGVDPATIQIETMTSGVSYAVLGVFSTEENARKFIAQVVRRSPEIVCRAYKFQGSKFMVSGFESTDAAAVSAFLRTSRAAYPDLWIYTRK